MTVSISVPSTSPSSTTSHSPLPTSSLPPLSQVHFDGYNKRHASDGSHDPLKWEEYQEKIETFKKEHIHRNIIDTEINELSYPATPPSQYPPHYCCRVFTTACVYSRVLLTIECHPSCYCRSLVSKLPRWSRGSRSDITHCSVVCNTLATNYLAYSTAMLLATVVCMIQSKAHHTLVSHNQGSSLGAEFIFLSGSCQNDALVEHTSDAQLSPDRTPPTATTSQ